MGQNKLDINFLVYWGQINKELKQESRGEAIYNKNENFFGEILEDRGGMYTIKKISPNNKNEIEIINKKEFLSLNEYLACENTEKYGTNTATVRENTEDSRKYYEKNTSEVQTFTGLDANVKRILFGNVPAKTWNEYRLIMEKIGKNAETIRKNTSKKQTQSNLNFLLKDAQVCYFTRDFEGLEKISSKVNKMKSSQSNMIQLNTKLERKAKIRKILKRIAIGLITLTLIIFSIIYFSPIFINNGSIKKTIKQDQINIDQLISEIEKKHNLKIYDWRKDIILSNISADLTQSQVYKLIENISLSNEPKKYIKK